ncbi:hypothetical protein [Burkholderia sp. WAC0059]|uniref:hypothetical protein n=1 Tax=Burkholderia sp. WAC0059 TaxID=2066022 RepID=UPI0015E12F5F|nr:hypothetical protein [Burkholderia sp. WAC0059]
MGSRYAFAVVADVMRQPADEAAAQRLVDALSRDPSLSFVVYDGNIKGVDEPCNDTLYARRQTLLDAARPALIFVPGEYDWVSCGSTPDGSYDPDERLDLLRQTIFADTSSLGQNPLPFMRESEVPRFRPYRENVRWQLGDTLFIALNLPGGNNHYLDAGGRNGEFDDRTIANAFWLEHAAEYAKRRNARAIVIFVQADPFVERNARRDRFDWLHFGRRPPRDGYEEFRRSLVTLAQIFHGPVLIVHGDGGRLAHGVLIDQPLRNERGAKVGNVTGIAIALRDPSAQWLQVDVDPGRRPQLQVSVRDVPKNLPPLPPPPPKPIPPYDAEATEVPEITSASGASAVPEAQPGTPDVPQNASAAQPSGQASSPAGQMSSELAPDTAPGILQMPQPAAGSPSTLPRPTLIEPPASGAARNSMQRGF